MIRYLRNRLTQARVPQRAAFLFALLWLGIVAAGIYRIAVPEFDGSDFTAFYCAGQTLQNGQDPYREIPLGDCEHVHSRNPVMLSGVIIPAPLPPYALWGFAQFSRVRYETAGRLFALLSIAAAGFAIALLICVTSMPLLAILSAAFTAAFPAIIDGQFVALTLFSLVLSGWLLIKGREELAAFSAAATMFEPHIGLAVCASLFIWRPRARLPLLVIGIAALLISATAMPLQFFLEYVRDVLPAQAASESTWWRQLSLTSALTLFAVPEQTALTLAAAQYLISIILGVAVAQPVASRLGSPAAIAIIPPLFAVVGGTYIHGSQLLLAVPAALLLARSLPVTASLGVIGVVIDWTTIRLLWTMLLAVPTAATIAYYSRRLVRDALQAMIIVGLIAVAATRVQPTIFIDSLIPVVPHAYAQVSWAAFTHAATPSVTQQRFECLAKMLTWTALLVLCSLTFRRSGLVRSSNDI